jgi:hypothetical protein
MIYTFFFMYLKGYEWNFGLILHSHIFMLLVYLSFFIRLLCVMNL